MDHSLSHRRHLGLARGEGSGEPRTVHSLPKVLGAPEWARAPVGRRGITEGSHSWARWAGTLPSHPGCHNTVAASVSHRGSCAREKPHLDRPEQGGGRGPWDPLPWCLGTEPHQPHLCPKGAPRQAALTAGARRPAPGPAFPGRDSEQLDTPSSEAPIALTRSPDGFWAQTPKAATRLPWDTVEAQASATRGHRGGLPHGTGGREQRSRYWVSGQWCWAHPTWVSSH